MHDTSNIKHRPAPDGPIMIAVMGATGNGKTSFINLASSSNLQVGESLESCTDEVQLANEFTLDGRRVVLIDTPGFDDTTKSDTEVLRMIADFLASTYKGGSRLAGVIYIHRISDRRFSGIAGRNFKIFRELCGETSLKNVVLVTNMWGNVTRDVGKAREKELASIFLKPALDKGARMVAHHNTKQSAHDVIRHIMNNHPVVLQIQRELVDEQKEVTNTAAGETVNAALTEEIKRHEANMKAVREEMRRLEEEMCMVLEVSEEITLEYLQVLEWMEMKMEHMEAQAKLDREEAEMEHQVQMTLLSSRLEAAEVEAEIERLTMQHEINRLQAQLNL